jgi:hypothetical protein
MVSDKHLQALPVFFLLFEMKNIFVLAEGSRFAGFVIRQMAARSCL